MISTLTLLTALLLPGTQPQEETLYAIHRWDTRDGLPQNSITDLAQTPDGMLWLATMGGLVRFDGRQFLVEDVSSIPLLGSNRLSCLAVAANGDLFVGTSEGKLLRRKRDGWVQIAMPSSRGAGVGALALAGDGELYIGSGDGLFRLEVGEHAAERLLASPVHAIACGPEGEVYVAGQHRIIRLDDLEPTVLGMLEVRTLALDADGTLYASVKGRLLRWSLPEFEWVAVDADLGDIVELCFLDSGQLRVLGRRGSGTWDVKNKSWRASTALPERLGMEHFLCFLRDRAGNDWIGTDNSGVIELSKTPLQAIFSPSMQLDESSVAVAHSGSGRTFVLAENLFEYRDGALVACRGPRPRSIAPSASGGLWLATARGIEFQRDEERELIVPIAPPIQEHSTLLEASDGSLWFSRDTDLHHWKNGELETTDLMALGASPGTRSLYEDRAGQLWIGGLTGLCILGAGAPRVLRSGNDLPLGEVRCFYEAEDGSMWIGTYGGGISRVDDRQIRVLDTSYGLFENTASALVADGQGNLIVLGNRAVTSYSLDTLTAAFARELDLVHGRVYDAGPGIGVFEGNGVYQPRSAVDENGVIWFPTLHGIARFNTRQVSSPDAPPQARAHGKFDETSLVELLPDGTQRVELDPRQRDLQFEFSVPSFLQPRQVRFRYRLNGWDSHWRLSSDGSTVRYNDLAPGKYTFELEAAVADGLFGPRDASYVIVVPPTLLERQVVRLGLALIGIFALLGLGFYSARSARRRNALLELTVRDRTRELRDEVGVRERAEGELRRAGEELEAQVALRTEELARALADLERDVLRRERLESRLRESEKLEAVGRLAGGLAHDFNNILTAILGETDLALSDLATENDSVRLQAKLEQHLGNVRGAGLRAARLTRQLLAYSRQQVMQPVVVDPLDTLADLRSMLTRLIPDNVELSLTAHPETPPILIDPGQLEQVVVNLVVNAGEAMPCGGKIELLCRPTHDEHQQAAAEIMVSDTGTGLPVGIREHIFEPFFSTKGQARGLGLASVHGIVMQSGGTLDVESEPERGTSFRITFPAAQGRPVPAIPPEPICEAGGVTALLVDDEDAGRRITKLMLEQGGVHVLDTGSPEEAIELVRRAGNTIDLLVTDVVMPGMNGKQLSEAVRRIQPEIKVLFISGHFKEELDEKDLLDPAANFLPKPFDARGLLACVADLARRPQES